MNSDILNWDLLRESTWSWIGLIVAILVLASVVYWIRSWFQGDEDSGLAGDTQQMLLEAAEMRRTGALTEAEFRSIQSRLSRRPVDAPPAGADMADRHGSPVPTDGTGR